MFYFYIEEKEKKNNNNNKISWGKNFFREEIESNQKSCLLV
jgi:hypothetical protein